MIDLQGLLKSAMLARSVRGRRTIGFPRKHLREQLARLFYTEAPDPGDATHVIYKNLALLAPLKVVDRRLRFPLDIPHTPTVVQVANRFAPDGYVLINPGAAWPNKQWPPRAVRRGGRSRCARFRVAFAGAVGPGEQEIAHRVVAESAGAAEMSPPTTITDLVGIARSARLMISGDTGPLHIAGRRRHANRGALRPDAARAQRPVGSRTTWRSRACSNARASIERTVQEGRAVHRRHQRRRSDERRSPADGRA